ncbi:MAG: hypothetical protein AAGL98_08685, partial [Planctomycetota bacterium]
VISLAILATVAGAVVAVPVVAHDRGERGAERMHERGHSRGGARMRSLLNQYDTDEDGRVTQEEIDTARSEALGKFDANSDGSLTIEEYEALWLDAMRERMVDRFQAHDDDGDGVVTVEEFNEEFSGIVDRFDRNDDGALSEEDRQRREMRGGRDREREDTQ